MRKNISQEFANLFIIFYIHTGTVLWYYTLGKVAKCSRTVQVFFKKRKKKASSDFERCSRRIL